MASLLSPRRHRSSVWLRATEPRATSAADADEEPPPSDFRWLAAALSGLGAAGVGWLLVTGITVLGWVAADPGTLTQAVRTGTRLWLLAHGTGVGIGTLTLTLVPWGATAVFAYVVFRAAGFAGRQAQASRAHPAQVAAVTTAAYLAPVAVATWLLGGQAVLARGSATVPVALGLVALWGSARGLGRPVLGVAWLRSLALGVLAAVLVLVAGGAAALTWSLVDHLDQVARLTAALDPGVSGGLALVAAQLAFGPNAAVWAASYALGSGFVLGEQALVAPASTELGLLPGVPLLGGLPDPGPGSMLTLAWLAVGATAGAVAALPLVRSRHSDGFAAATLTGGLAGVAAAGTFVAVAWAAGGDLGVARLAGVGPRLLPLLVLAGSTLGLAGMVAGLAARSLRGRPSLLRRMRLPTR